VRRACEYLGLVLVTTKKELDAADTYVCHCERCSHDYFSRRIVVAGKGGVSYPNRLGHILTVLVKWDPKRTEGAAQLLPKKPLSWW
jgi:hypothetical protein